MSRELPAPRFVCDIDGSETLTDWAIGLAADRLDSITDPKELLHAAHRADELRAALAACPVLDVERLSSDGPSDPADDPILSDGGYPSEQELQRIRDWPWEGGFRSLMDYVRRRWQYADIGYWTQRGDHFEISTGGWSGNESLIGALEANQMFSMLCPLSWRRGGHYVYDVQEWDDNPEPGKRVFVRDPATPEDK